MLILLILYAGLIPAVPLIGAQIYRRRKDAPRRNLCYVLFFIQLAISVCYILEYVGRQPFYR